MSIVEKIERVRSQYNVSAKSLIAMVGISAATYMRWKRRLHRGDEPLRKPGVKKQLLNNRVVYHLLDRGSNVQVDEPVIPHVGMHAVG